MREFGGNFELEKFAARKPEYYEGLQEMLSLGFDATDYIHYFPAFAGPMTISRYLSLYEAYKMTLGVAGHIAEIGVFKGAGSLFFAKLAALFEPQSLTLVHGFDWFQGAKITGEEKFVSEGECSEDYDRVMRLIRAQRLDNVVHVHNLDVTKDLGRFFTEHSHLQFKLVFADCGIYDVVKSTLEHFWPRLTSGGIMIFDQFNHEVAPGETRAIKEFMPDAKMRTFPFGWMPTAYVVKP
ncbi:MAG TPA: class I SAM-dependent methyltransferase [Pyrinomonadaceae bacterium]